MMEDRERVGEEDQNALEAIYEGFDFANKFEKRFLRGLLTKNVSTKNLEFIERKNGT